MALSEQERTERARVSKRKYYLQNRERILKESSARQKANRERCNGYSRAWAARNAESERARARAKNWKVSHLPAPTRPEPELCECCGRSNRRALALDHCHVTGEFRGWLCDACNMGLGKLGDTVEALERALAYLKRK
jgi:hypothetical protein